MAELIESYENNGNYSSAFMVNLAAITSSEYVDSISIARQAIEISKASSGTDTDTTSILYDTLTAVEHSIAKLWDNDHNDPDVVSSHFLSKMSILHQLIQSQKISTLSFMSFYCSMEMCEKIINNHPSHEPRDINDAADMMKEVNELMDEKIQKVDVNLTGVIKLMHECMIGKETIQAAKDLMKLDEKSLNDNVIKKHLKSWATLLDEASKLSGDISNESKHWFNQAYDKIYFKLYNAIAATKSTVDIKTADIDGSEITPLAVGQHYRPNMSDGLNSNTRTCIYKHWASPLCQGYVDPRLPYLSKVDRGNGCIAAYLHYISFNIATESGVSITDEILDGQDGGTVFIDDHIDVVNNKGTHEKEHRALENDTKLSSSERRLIPAFNLISHAIYALWHGRKLRVAVGSAEAFRVQFDSNAPCVTRLIIFVAYISHGENLMNPKTYLTAASVSTPTLDELSQKLVCIYSAFDKLAISSVSKIMYILARRDVNESPELQALLIQLRIAGSILGGLNCQKLRRLGEEKLGIIIYETVISHNWGDVFSGLDNNNANNKFHEVVQGIVGSISYKNLTRKQWNLIYSGVRGGYVTTELRKECRNKIGAELYDKVVKRDWGSIMNELDDSVARDKFHEEVKTLVGDNAYERLKLTQWNLIYGSIRGGYVTTELRKECRKKIGAESYNKVVEYDWGPILNELGDNAARDKFHEEVKTLVGDDVYKLLKPTQWNLIYGGIRTAELRKEAYTILVEGKVNNLNRNHLSLLLNKKIDEGDVDTLRELA